MATYKVLSADAPYFTLEVKFLDQTFVQNVLFQENGDSLAKAMQAYADTYEAEWIEAQAIAANE